VKPSRRSGADGQFIAGEKPPPGRIIDVAVSLSHAYDDYCPVVHPLHEPFGRMMVEVVENLISTVLEHEKPIPNSLRPALQPDSSMSRGVAFAPARRELVYHSLGNSFRLRATASSGYELNKRVSFTCSSGLNLSALLIRIHRL